MNLIDREIEKLWREFNKPGLARENFGLLMRCSLQRVISETKDKCIEEQKTSRCYHNCDLINFDTGNYKCPNCGELLNKILWSREQDRRLQAIQQSKQNTKGKG